MSVRHVSVGNPRKSLYMRPLVISVNCILKAVIVCKVYARVLNRTALMYLRHPPSNTLPCASVLGLLVSVAGTLIISPYSIAGRCSQLDRVSRLGCQTRSPKSNHPPWLCYPLDNRTPGDLFLWLNRLDLCVYIEARCRVPVM